ncbi:MAG TPA: polysaccharide biosynthesis/export family protein [Pirellulales bacterium]|jgi:polysaccharide export outer membrane protein
MRNAPQHVVILTMALVASKGAVSGEWMFRNISDAVFAGPGYTPAVLDVDTLLSAPRLSLLRRARPPYLIEPPDVLSIEVHRFSRDDVVVDQAGQSANELLRGEFRVGPDGTIDLAHYGKVRVTGLTVRRAQEVVCEHIRDFERLPESSAPEVSLDVFAYNSKVYYVVIEGADLGDQIQRIPIAGNETVLDALAQVRGLKHRAKVVWVARPASVHGARKAEVLHVDVNAIVHRGDQSTNWPIFPGDRVFVTPANVSLLRDSPTRFTREN